MAESPRGLGAAAGNKIHSVGKIHQLMLLSNVDDLNPKNVLYLICYSSSSCYIMRAVVLLKELEFFDKKKDI
jgi:hypothetical protein